MSTIRTKIWKPCARCFPFHWNLSTGVGQVRSKIPYIPSPSKTPHKTGYRGSRGTQTDDTVFCIYYPSSSPANPLPPTRKRHSSERLWKRKWTWKSSSIKRTMNAARVPGRKRKLANSSSHKSGCVVTITFSTFPLTLAPFFNALLHSSSNFENGSDRTRPIRVGGQVRKSGALNNNNHTGTIGIGRKRRREKPNKTKKQPETKQTFTHDRGHPWAWPLVPGVCASRRV